MKELEEALRELALEASQAHATIQHQREVMRQALEALEESWRTDKGDAAITALRAALSDFPTQPEFVPSTWPEHGDGGKEAW